jgi:hypothetical protein
VHKVGARSGPAIWRARTAFYKTATGAGFQNLVAGQKIEPPPRCVALLTQNLENPQRIEVRVHHALN